MLTFHLKNIALSQTIFFLLNATPFRLTLLLLFYHYWDDRGLQSSYDLKHTYNMPIFFKKYIPSCYNEF